MKVHIYNENTLRFGEPVNDRHIEEHETPDEAGDWTCYEGTPQELLQLADELELVGPYNIYQFRKARTLREAVED